MREIKFRAWDKASKEILYVESHQNADRLKVSFSGTPFEENEVQPDFEFMQFTGLTDKNGKEIYEGDLLALNGVGESVDVRWSDEIQGWSPKVLRGATTWQVIGNIYENPDLLAV
jgi:uncharacterized phage protein (TIGR01671 family)